MCQKGKKLKESLNVCSSENIHRTGKYAVEFSSPTLGRQERLWVSDAEDQAGGSESCCSLKWKQTHPIADDIICWEGTAKVWPKLSGNDGKI